MFLNNTLKTEVTSQSSGYHTKNKVAHECLRSKILDISVKESLNESLEGKWCWVAAGPRHGFWSAIIQFHRRNPQFYTIFWWEAISIECNGNPSHCSRFSEIVLQQWSSSALMSVNSVVRLIISVVMILQNPSGWRRTKQNRIPPVVLNKRDLNGGDEKDFI